MIAQRNVVLAAVLAVLPGCASPGANEAQYLKVWFSADSFVPKEGGYICRELEPGTWEMKCLAEGKPSVKAHVRAPAPSLQAMVEEFRRTVRETEDHTRGVSDFRMTVELGSAKRSETIVVAGTFARIHEVFRRSAAIADLQRQFDTAMPLEKGYWFRAFSFDPASGEWDPVPPGWRIEVQRP